VKKVMVVLGIIMVLLGGVMTACDETPSEKDEGTVLQTTIPSVITQTPISTPEPIYKNVYSTISLGGVANRKMSSPAGYLNPPQGKVSLGEIPFELLPDTLNWIYTCVACF